MSLFGAVLTHLSPADIVKVIAEYGPAIEALIHFIEKERDDKLRANSMDSITRGLQHASETGDTSTLEEALRSHCSPTDGCRIL